MEKQPWYQWAHRWNQVNSVETDPRDCDLEVWRRYWRENGIQGTIINAAGTVGYYPSSNPYQYRAKFLGGRDYFGDFCNAARGEGLVVVARMDSNQAAEELFDINPQWFCRDKEGNPLRQTPRRYYTCINSDYYTGQLSGMIREIIEQYHPDAFADNTITGPRGIICYCDNCREKFKADSGLDLPEQAEFADRTFRVWLGWNQRCRVERYAWFNEISTQYGGEDCIYMGMFKDAYSKGILELVMDDVEYARWNKAIMIDGQIRMHSTGFDSNSLQGLAMHEIFGDETLVLESIATYSLAPNMMRKSANTGGETSSWMRAAMIGGISPSTHFIGGVQEDKRALKNGTAMFRWHRENEEYLYHRTPISNVGLVRSFANTCYYGQNDSGRKVELPTNGMVAALKRGRIPYFPIDARQIGDKLHKTKLLILPEIAVLTDRELQDIERFVRGGGSLVFTGSTGMLDELGYPRKQHPLDDLLGIKRVEAEPLEPQSQGDALQSLGDYSMHNYIRIAELRHPIFKGFDGTPIIGLHGVCYHVTSSKLAEVAHMVPSFPTYPPEVSFMNDGEHVSKQAAVLAGETGFGGRAVYFAADYDRKHGETFFHDYGNLLKNAVMWALGEENLPFTVKGPGELDCKLFSQERGRRLVLHLLNHSGLGRWPGSVEEIYPVGPQEVCISVGDLPVKEVRAQNLGKSIDFDLRDGKLNFSLDQVNDQELVVIR